jgi:hypothetical protein
MAMTAMTEVLTQGERICARAYCVHRALEGNHLVAVPPGALQ